MRNKPTLTEIVRDAALDNDFGTDRALVLVQRLNHVYGGDKGTRKALDELADILIGIQERARLIHQAAEQDCLSTRTAERQDAARRELERADEEQSAYLSQFM
jgi:hypothetical protein